MASNDLSVARYVRDAVRNPITAIRFFLDYLARTKKLDFLAGPNGVRYLDEVKPFYKKIVADLSRENTPLSSTLRPWGIPLIYAIVRAKRPKSVVETGVASGISSAFILEALEKNAQGTLCSIDLPNSLLLPRHKSTGWIIPLQLRTRWKLIIGDSRTHLLPLLGELGTIDMFLHDSEHTYSTMYHEFQKSWEHLRIGGILICDDWWQTDALPNFAKNVEHKWVHIARFGFIEKQHS